jgi:hypothetical protein
MKIIYTLLILVVCTSLAFANELNINTIDLKHRLASDLLPKIEAFLPEGATVKAHENLLILKSDAETYYEIKKLLTKLDTPLKRLMVTVLRTHASLSELQGNSVQNDLEVDDIAYANTQVRRWSNRTDKDENNYFQAQGINEQPILITLGQQTPQTEQLVLFNSSGDTAVATQTHYLNIENGFNAIVNVRANNQVTVAVHPFFANINDQAVIKRSQVFTTIAGPVDHWLALGQVNNEKSIEKSQLNKYSTQRNQQNIYLKVTLIP